MRFQFIHNHRETFDVGRMCGTLKVSRGGFYEWMKRPPSAREQENAELVCKMKLIHKKCHETYGSPRMHASLKNANGKPYSKNRIARLMRKNGIRAKTKRKFKATTLSKHNRPVAPNLLDQNFSIDRPNAVWVSDITYVPTGEGWLYLATTLDLFSRKVVGWAMDSHMKTDLVMAALRMAIQRRAIEPGLIHHSDRGVQYASQDFQDLLSSVGMVCSMSRKGNCYDNAVQESWYHTMKTELVHHEHFATRDEALAKIFQYIEVFYNRERLHSSLGYLAPAQFESKHLAA